MAIVDEANLVQIAVAEEVAMPVALRRRKKTSLTCLDIWTRSSLSSSLEVAKVRNCEHRWHVSFANDTLVTGTLKGYDQLMNLVLDNVKEITRGTRSQH